MATTSQSSAAPSSNTQNEPKSQDQTEQPENVAILVIATGQTDPGVELGADMKVVRIKAGSPADGKLHPGDKIIKVDKDAVASVDQFQAAVRRYLPTVKVYFERGLQTAQDDVLPPSREKNLQRRAGYDYKLVRLDFQKGCKFGLGIKHFQNKVFVSRVDDGSISAKTLILGDRIVDVNGDPVSDKDVARTMLVKSLAKNKTVSLLIERPVSEAARNEMKAAMNASQLQPPSVAHPSDVREIVKKQLARPIAQKATKSALKKSGGMKKSAGKVKISDQARDIAIRDDNEGKQLQHVKKDDEPKSASGAPKKP
ncbi:PDZ domain-containing protein [Aphelenchoides avenae]|nr:PDZ domain-containing protein [Aphelenchus avenae]